MNRVRSDGEETKRRIAEKTSQLVIQKGYSVFTMNEVCEAAQVSKGSLYHHFPSKEELFLHVIEDDTLQWLNEWNRIKMSYATVEQKLFGFAEYYASDFQNPLLREIENFERGREISEDVRIRLVQICYHGSQACRELVNEALATGYLPPNDPEYYVSLITAILEGIGKVIEMNGSDKQISQLKQEYTQALSALLNGIRAAK
ncbi:HTH-type transcriptional regulator QacR [compost metagenome]